MGKHVMCCSAAWGDNSYALRAVPATQYSMLHPAIAGCFCEAPRTWQETQAGSTNKHLRRSQAALLMMLVHPCRVGQGEHARALTRPCTVASGPLALAPCRAAPRLPLLRISA